MRKYRFIRGRNNRIEIQWGWLFFWFDLEGYNPVYDSIEEAHIGLQEYKNRFNRSSKEVLWVGF